MESIDSLAPSPAPTGENTGYHYRKVQQILAARGIRYVAMQYPTRPVQELKDFLGDEARDVVFVEKPTSLRGIVRPAAIRRMFQRPVRRRFRTHHGLRSSPDRGGGRRRDPRRAATGAVSRSVAARRLADGLRATRWHARLDARWRMALDG
jgi:hypothetical protein